MGDVVRAAAACAVGRLRDWSMARELDQSYASVEHGARNNEQNSLSEIFIRPSYFSFCSFC
jgi:hypothetical protein